MFPGILDTVAFQERIHSHLIFIPAPAWKNRAPNWLQAGVNLS